jgi:predicted alpha-1,6-mannanase (GH76 family)
MWAVIACLRAYRITGDASYLSQARQTFDQTYARSWSSALGGGLWNTTGRLGKNTCVNSPAVIAGCMLYQSLHDASYLAKARALYRWIRANLYDPATGAVYDHVSPGPGRGRVVVSRTAFTYNQGGFIGAADLLHQVTSDRRYYRDALMALAFTRRHMTTGGILKGEISSTKNIWASAGGFKGMFVRWATTFINDNHVRGYRPWFQRNVAAVRDHINAAGLMDENWPVQTGGGTLTAFSCSSAVVLLQWYPPAAP